MRCSKGSVPAWFDDVRAGIMERLLRLSRHVPPAVELGYHLCYGDGRHRHTAAKDARKLVEIANALAASLDRPLNWLHMPVPVNAAESYFSPMAALMLRAETELYLGVIDPSDGLGGALRRIRMARSFVDGFGAATVCGWGRQPERIVPELLKLHAEVARPVVSRSRSARVVRMAERLRSDTRRRLDAMQPVDRFGLAYDKVERHSWYRNLDPIVEELAGNLKDGDIMVDYSGGTGILPRSSQVENFRPRGRHFDSGQFAALFACRAREVRRRSARLAFRLLRFLKEEKRVQRIKRSVEPAAPSARSRHHRVHQCGPSLHGPGGKTALRVGFPFCGPAAEVVHQFRKYPQPARQAQSVGSWMKRCGS